MKDMANFTHITQAGSTHHQQLQYHCHAFASRLPEMTTRTPSAPTSRHRRITLAQMLRIADSSCRLHQSDFIDSSGAVAHASFLCAIMISQLEAY